MAAWHSQLPAWLQKYVTWQIRSKYLEWPPRRECFTAFWMVTRCLMFWLFAFILLFWRLNVSNVIFNCRLTLIIRLPSAISVREWKHFVYILSRHYRRQKTILNLIVFLFSSKSEPEKKNPFHTIIKIKCNFLKQFPSFQLHQSLNFFLYLTVWLTVCVGFSQISLWTTGASPLSRLVLLTVAILRVHPAQRLLHFPPLW